MTLPVRNQCFDEGITRLINKEMHNEYQDSDEKSEERIVETIEGELQEMFKLVGCIEDRIIYPTPEKLAESPQPETKLTDKVAKMKNINRRLSKICALLAVLE